LILLLHNVFWAIPKVFLGKNPLDFIHPMIVPVKERKKEVYQVVIRESNRVPYPKADGEYFQLRHFPEFD
jgi:hypothetical protein